MITRSLDLDLDFPISFPDLPPPWPPTDAAIEWWMGRADHIAISFPLDVQLANAHREHQSEPFVMD